MKKLTIFLCAGLLSAMSAWADATQTLPNVPCGGKVQISATAKTGYEFVRWDDGNTENPRTIENVTTATTYTAIFQLKKYTLNPADFGTGVTLNGSSTPIEVEHGSIVTVLATATGCDEFDKWSDDDTTNPRTFVCTGTGAPFTVTYKTKMINVTVNADPNQGDVTISIVP